MKKTLSVLLCLLLTVSLMAGCGSKEKIETEPASQSEAASAADEKPMEPAAPFPAQLRRIWQKALSWRMQWPGPRNICPAPLPMGWIWEKGRDL